MILSICREYVAKRSADKAVFQCCAQFEALIEQPGSGEMAFFVLKDRQTDRQTDMTDHFTHAG